MAKLSARGRTELWRVERTYKTDAGGTIRIEIACMSDGKFLKKQTAFAPTGKKAHDWGWKQYAKLKKGGNADNVKQKFLAEGYTETTRR